VSHTVTLTPTEVSVVPGGAPAVVAAVVDGVPADTSVAQAVDVSVGTSVVSVGFTVKVDNPEPMVVIHNPDPSLTVSASTPVPQGGGQWTFEITVQA
jgi:hypothetical protein